MILATGERGRAQASDRSHWRPPLVLIVYFRLVQAARRPSISRWGRPKLQCRKGAKAGWPDGRRWWRWRRLCRPRDWPRLPAAADRNSTANENGTRTTPAAAGATFAFAPPRPAPSRFTTTRRHRCGVMLTRPSLSFQLSGGAPLLCVCVSAGPSSATSDRRLSRLASQLESAS